MNTDSLGGAASGPKYATSFRENLLGGACDVEVVVNIETKEASATLAMRQLLSSNPAFLISRDDLVAISQNIGMIQSKSPLLDSLIDGALHHQLNYSRKSAVLIVVHPKDRPARFTLSIGLFHQEGPLSELSSKEIDDAVSRLDTLTAAVVAKVASCFK